MPTRVPGELLGIMTRPDASPGCHLLFVYGTLRQGFELHHHLVRIGAKLTGRGKVAGDLFDLGRYPAALPSNRSGRRIHGEVYYLPRPEHDLRVLDGIEGFNLCAPERGEFVRAMTEVSREGGEPYRAWVYWLNRSAPRGRRIASGDYLQWQVRGDTRV
jgi:gamma-glutamylcyclotransferase (GGCT)/AIG2-like uncharacterized protein YtfP